MQRMLFNFFQNISLMEKTFSACPYFFPLLPASEEKIQERVFPHSHDWEKFSSRQTLSCKSPFTTKWDAVR